MGRKTETFQDVDEAHHILSSRGIADGELSERVEDLAGECDNLEDEVKRLRAALSPFVAVARVVLVPGDEGRTDRNWYDAGSARGRAVITYADLADAIAAAGSQK